MTCRYIVIKLTKSSRKKRNERMFSPVFCRMSEEYLVGVLDIDLVFGEKKLGTNPRRILETNKLIFQA